MRTFAVNRREDAAECDPTCDTRVGCRGELMWSALPETFCHCTEAHLYSARWLVIVANGGGTTIMPSVNSMVHLELDDAEQLYDGRVNRKQLSTQHRACWWKTLYDTDLESTRLEIRVWDTLCVVKCWSTTWRNAVPLPPKTESHKSDNSWL